MGHTSHTPRCDRKGTLFHGVALLRTSIIEQVLSLAWCEALGGSSDWQAVQALGMSPPHMFRMWRATLTEAKRSTNATYDLIHAVVDIHDERISRLFQCRKLTEQ